ncbi:MAG TPA: RNA methyltransferase [Piscinibacter sp.]|uniref:TrmH family RNA methyltransferase n=1 Tax=Piscinibacter sp. TaxID=1903157 RepID=UPI0011D33528|nr:MAG: RNA methyltransferase [Burkholderiaceae bacterium]HNJ82438.1 RNA methyltransferase [Piscinibacter sp.]HNK17567.1 RNA methyltransferase [Piscinibacter sp.]
MAEPRTISSKDNPLLVRVRKLLADPGGYRKLGEVWLEGEHLCAAFVQRGGRPLQAIVSAEGWPQPALRELAGHAAAVAVVPDELMAALSTLESPPAIGFVVATPTAPAITPDAPSLVLDRLQDAGNVGTILRSAAAFGFTQVVALKGTAALWSPKVLRAGMGAHFGLRLVEGVEADALAALRVPLLATSSHAARSLHEVDLPWPCAWVMGHEGQGVSPVLEQRCAMTLRIPQPGGEESLNVAAAAAVCLYESARQRVA